MKNVLASCCLLVFILSIASANAETLLSRNATYSITGSGYVYPGQIQPGVNDAAEIPGMVFTPLVERTDSGDRLIDGDPSDASKIYTPWIWDQPFKAINIEMTLPGESKVSRVLVHFPQDREYCPLQVSLYAKDASGQWQRPVGMQTVYDERKPLEPSPASVAFQLDKYPCRELKMEVGGRGRLHVGVTEVEVWGEGPTESDRRGLVPGKPHIESITPPIVDVPKGDINLSDSAKIRIESSKTCDPKALIDGNRSKGIRIEGKHQEDLYITAELDLGDTYLIDAVCVWMPGGNGVRSGHVNDVKLAISPSADQVDWDTPAGKLVNAYWPMDDAPKPYVIPADNLQIPGRRVRVQACLSGRGGLTSVLALGEIEVWGRRLEGPVPSASRLNLRPVRIDTEAVAKLDPKWEELRERRIRGIWPSGDLDDPFGQTDKTCGQVLSEAGFNTVVIDTEPDHTDPSIAPKLEGRIRRNAAEAHKYGMLLFAKWQYGSDHKDPYRRFREVNGRLHVMSCCPLDGDYIERHVGRWAVESARLGADGFTFDTEMYQSDNTSYPSACYCDDCFKDYVQNYSTNWQSRYDRVKPEIRGDWVEANGAKSHYEQYQVRRLIKQYDAIRVRCQEVNPDFLFAYAPFVEYLPGMTNGLGTPERPVIAWSEREYEEGPDQRTVSYLNKVRDQKLSALYACGHMLWYQDPKTLTDNALIASLHTDGWWAWYGGALLRYVGTDDPTAFKSPYGRAEGYSAMQYLDAIKAMHQRLDALLKQPKDQWPKSEKGIFRN